MRWLAYCLMTVSFGAAVFLKGGVYAQQWEWSALGVSIAAVVSLLPRHERSPGNLRGLTLMAALLGWMLLQLVPLPPALLHALSPVRWTALSVARQTTGQAPGGWAPLSLAPAATIERLLDVIPAMAAFVTAREMAWWWRDRIWVVVVPIVGAASIESLLGLVQFYFMRLGGGQAGSAVGTYVNRNHFAGLLEMAFPLALMGAIATWRKGRSRLQPESIGPALGTSALLAMASFLLMGVILSLSRMGFISTLIAAGFTILMLLLSLGSTESRWMRGFRLSIPVAVPLFVLVFLPTRELLARFADMSATEDVSKDTRMEIWQDTLQSVAAYKWTGSGLGAYERGLYRYKTVAPTQTVDFAHNDYLQILAELGFVGAGLVAALGLWILWGPLSVVLWGGDTANWTLAVGLFAALLTMAIHSFADFNLYIPANALACAWLAGIAVSPGLRPD